MKAVLEIGVFLACSVALHAAVLVQLPQGAAMGAGDGGADRATVAAASPEITDLVARWTAPPLVAPVAPTLAAAPGAPALPDLPQLSDRPALPGPAAPPLPEPAAELAPAPDIAPPVALPVTRPQARPDRAPQPQQPRQPRQAAGSGGGGTQGQTGPAPAATQSDALRQTLMATWGAQITARIERGKPRVSGRGVVTLHLVVARDGQLQGITVARSSGDAGLDAAALAAVQSIGRLPPAPDGLAGASHRFALPIRFR